MLVITNTKQKLSLLRQSAATMSDLADGSVITVPGSKKGKAFLVDARTNDQGKEADHP